MFVYKLNAMTSQFNMKWREENDHYRADASSDIVAIAVENILNDSGYNVEVRCLKKSILINRQAFKDADKILVQLAIKELQNPSQDDKKIQNSDFVSYDNFCSDHGPEVFFSIFKNQLSSLPEINWILDGNKYVTTNVWKKDEAEDFKQRINNLFKKNSLNVEARLTYRKSGFSLIVWFPQIKEALDMKKQNKM